MPSRSSNSPRNKIKQLRRSSLEKLNLRAGLTETGKESQFINCTTQSEKAEEICELRKKNLSIHGSVEDNDKSVDSA